MPDNSGERFLLLRSQQLGGWHLGRHSGGSQPGNGKVILHDAVF